MKGVMRHGFVRFPVRLISLASIALTKISLERVTFRRMVPTSTGRPAKPKRSAGRLHASALDILFCFLAAMLALGLTRPLMKSGSLRGEVTDPSGAVVPGAKILVFSEHDPNAYLRRAVTEPE
jgi:hypothetical protein